MANAKYRYWTTGKGLEAITAWAREGLTDEDLAKRIGIGVRTIYDWKKRYPQFLQALNNNKAVADGAVENALYKRAIGYEYTETYVIKGGKEDGAVKTVTKHMPPDVIAAIFWLKNRKPKQWRDKVEVEHSGQIDVAETLQTAREEAAEMARKAEEGAKN